MGLLICCFHSYPDCFTQLPVKYWILGPVLCGRVVIIDQWGLWNELYIFFCHFPGPLSISYPTFRIWGAITAAKMYETPQLVVMPAITKHVRHDSCYINAPKLFESNSQKLNYKNQMLTFHICYLVFCCRLNQRDKLNLASPRKYRTLYTRQTLPTSCKERQINDVLVNTIWWKKWIFKTYTGIHFQFTSNPTWSWYYR